MKIPLVKKALILLLTMLYFSSQVMLNALAEANMWSERRNAFEKKTSETEIQYAGLPANLNSPFPSAVLPKNNQTFAGVRLSRSLQSLVNHIPLNIANIQEIYEGKNSPTVLRSDGASHNKVGQSDGRTVGPILLLQDIHMNIEAQGNSAALLQQLINDNQVGAVGVEGAFDLFDFVPFRAYKNPQKTAAVLKPFFDKNLLAAPSYVGITSPIDPPPFIGVDDKQHYQANINAYLEAIKSKSKILSDIANERHALVSEMKATSPELQAFESLRSEYQQGYVGIGVYLEKLSKQAKDFSDFEIEQYLSAYAMEKSIDFNRVNLERLQVFQKLTRVLTKQESSELLAQSWAYKTGQIGFGAYYQNLKNLCDQKNFSLKAFPAFDAYVRYVLLSDGIKADRLFAAVEKLEDNVAAQYTSTEQEKELLAASQHLSLSKKLVEFSLTAKEWQQYCRGGLLTPQKSGEPVRLSEKNAPTQLRATYYVAPTMLEPFERFYEEADLRSQKMVANLLSNKISDLSDSHRTSRTSVLVVGGFHTQQITELLKTRNVSYVVVSPKISQVDSAAGSSYLSIFAREKTPLDQIFKGERLFLSPESVQATSYKFAVPALAALAVAYLGVNPVKVIWHGIETLVRVPSDVTKLSHYVYSSGGNFDLVSGLPWFESVVHAFHSLWMNGLSYVAIAVVAIGIVKMVGVGATSWDSIAADVVMAVKGDKKVVKIGGLPKVKGKRAVFLIKPTSGIPVEKTVADMLRTLADNKAVADEITVFDGDVLAEREIMAAHYGRITEVATQGFAALNPEEKEKVTNIFSQSVFQNFFGQTFNEAFVLSARDLQKAGLTEDVIDKVWIDAGASAWRAQMGQGPKMGEGVYALPIKFPDAENFPAALRGRSVVILNGFSAKQRADFEKPGQRTVAVSVRLMEGAPSFDFIRKQVIGETDPAKAATGSFRNKALLGSQGDPTGFKVNGPVNGAANLVHFSEDEQAGEREYKIWFTRRTSEVMQYLPQILLWIAISVWAHHSEWFRVIVAGIAAGSSFPLVMATQILLFPATSLSLVDWKFTSLTRQTAALRELPDYLVSHSHDEVLHLRRATPNLHHALFAGNNLRNILEFATSLQPLDDYEGSKAKNRTSQELSILDYAIAERRIIRLGHNIYITATDVPGKFVLFEHRSHAALTDENILRKIEITVPALNKQLSEPATSIAVVEFSQPVQGKSDVKAFITDFEKDAHLAHYKEVRLISHILMRELDAIILSDPLDKLRNHKARTEVSEVIAIFSSVYLELRKVLKQTERIIHLTEQEQLSEREFLNWLRTLENELETFGEARSLAQKFLLEHPAAASQTLWGRERDQTLQEAVDLAIYLETRLLGPVAQIRKEYGVSGTSTMRALPIPFVDLEKAAARSGRKIKTTELLGDQHVYFILGNLKYEPRQISGSVRYWVRSKSGKIEQLSETFTLPHNPESPAQLVRHEQAFRAMDRHFVDIVKTSLMSGRILIDATKRVIYDEENPSSAIYKPVVSVDVEQSTVETEKRIGEFLAQQGFPHYRMHLGPDGAWLEDIKGQSLADAPAVLLAKDQNTYPNIQEFGRLAAMHIFLGNLDLHDENIMGLSQAVNGHNLMSYDPENVLFKVSDFHSLESMLNDFFMPALHEAWASGDERDQEALVEQFWIGFQSGTQQIFADPDIQNKLFKSLNLDQRSSAAVRLVCRATAKYKAQGVFTVPHYTLTLTKSEIEENVASNLDMLRPVADGSLTFRMVDPFVVKVEKAHPNASVSNSLLANPGFKIEGRYKLLYLILLNLLGGAVVLAIAPMLWMNPATTLDWTLPFGLVSAAIFIHEFGHGFVAALTGRLQWNRKVIFGWFIGQTPLKPRGPPTVADRAVALSGILFNLATAGVLSAYRAHFDAPSPALLVSLAAVSIVVLLAEAFAFVPRLRSMHSDLVRAGLLKISPPAKVSDKMRSKTEKAERMTRRKFLKMIGTAVVGALVAFQLRLKMTSIARTPENPVYLAFVRHWGKDVSSMRKAIRLAVRDGKKRGGNPMALGIVEVVANSVPFVYQTLVGGDTSAVKPESTVTREGLESMLKLYQSDPAQASHMEQVREKLLPGENEKIRVETYLQAALKIPQQAEFIGSFIKLCQKEGLTTFVIEQGSFKADLLNALASAYYVDAITSFKAGQSTEGVNLILSARSMKQAAERERDLLLGQQITRMRKHVPNTAIFHARGYIHEANLALISGTEEPAYVVRSGMDTLITLSDLASLKFLPVEEQIRKKTMFVLAELLSQASVSDMDFAEILPRIERELNSIDTPEIEKWLQAFINEVLVEQKNKNISWNLALKNIFLKRGFVPSQSAFQKISKKLITTILGIFAGLKSTAAEGSSVEPIGREELAKINSELKQLLANRGQGNFKVTEEMLARLKEINLRIRATNEQAYQRDGGKWFIETSGSNIAAADKNLMDELILTARRILKMPEGKTLHLLDLGSANGNHLEYMVGKDPHLKAEAVEIIPEFIAELQKLAAMGKVAKVHAVEMEDLRGIPDESMDVVRCQASLLHVLDGVSGMGADAVLAEAKRVLKPGGLFYVFTKAGSGLGMDAKGRVFNYHTKESAQDLVERNGFEVVGEVEERPDPSGRSDTKWIYALARKPPYVLRTTYVNNVPHVGFGLGQKVPNDFPTVYYFDIFDVQLNPAAAEKIKEAVKNDPHRLALMTKEQLLTSRIPIQVNGETQMIGASERTPTIIEDMPRVVDAVRQKLLQILPPVVDYFSWREKIPKQGRVLVHIAGQARIKINGKYLLVRYKNDFSDGAGRMVPMGGFLKATEETREELRKMGVTEFEKGDESNDLRFWVDVANLPKIEQWVLSRKQRELTIDRELREEMQEYGIFTEREMDVSDKKPTPGQVFYQYIGRLQQLRIAVARVRQAVQEGKSTEDVEFALDFLYFVADSLSTDLASTQNRLLRSVNDKRYEFVLDRLKNKTGLNTIVAGKQIGDNKWMLSVLADTQIPEMIDVLVEIFVDDPDYVNSPDQKPTETEFAARVTAKWIRHQESVGRTTVVALPKSEAPIVQPVAPVALPIALPSPVELKMSPMVESADEKNLAARVEPSSKKDRQLNLAVLLQTIRRQHREKANDVSYLAKALQVSETEIDATSELIEAAPAMGVENLLADSVDDLLFKLQRGDAADASSAAKILTREILPSYLALVNHAIHTNSSVGRSFDRDVAQKFDELFPRRTPGEFAQAIANARANKITTADLARINDLLRLEEVKIELVDGNLVLIGLSSGRVTADILGVFLRAKQFLKYVGAFYYYALVSAWETTFQVLVTQKLVTLFAFSPVVNAYLGLVIGGFIFWAAHIVALWLAKKPIRGNLFNSRILVVLAFTEILAHGYLFPKFYNLFVIALFLAHWAWDYHQREPDTAHLAQTFVHIEQLTAKGKEAQLMALLTSEMVRVRDLGRPTGETIYADVLQTLETPQSDEFHRQVKSARVREGAYDEDKVNPELFLAVLTALKALQTTGSVLKTRLDSKETRVYTIDKEFLDSFTDLNRAHAHVISLMIVGGTVQQIPQVLLVDEELVPNFIALIGRMRGYGFSGPISVKPIRNGMIRHNQVDPQTLERSSGVPLENMKLVTRSALSIADPVGDAELSRKVEVLRRHRITFEELVPIVPLAVRKIIRKLRLVLEAA